MNRGRLGKLTATWLPFRPQDGRPNWLAEASIAALIVVVAIVNVGTLPGFKDSVPGVVRTVRNTLSLGQVWNMFAPHPMDVEGWYVARGVAKDGSVVDVLHPSRGEPSWARPADLATEYANYRWRKYLTRIWRPKYSAHQARYARYLCERWNRSRPFGMRLQTIGLYFLKEPVLFTKETRPVEKIFLVEHSCLKAPPLRSAPDQRDVDAF